MAVSVQVKAILKSANLSHSAVDESTGVISGCKLFQVGGTATYKGEDGKPRSFERTADVAKALLAHAGNRSIPSHFTHEYDSKGDTLPHRLGLHKNLRIDEATGDLLSDLHTMPNEYGKLALWTAKTDPNSAAFSAVFNYNPIKDGDKTLAVPTSFDAADFVSSGAACSAMLSQFTQDTDMTKDEIQSLIRDELKAALADFKPALPENLITKEDSDKAITAALAAHKPTLSDEEKATLVAEGEAALVAKLGAGVFQHHIGQKKDGDTYTAKLEEYRKSSPNEATAVARLLKDHPELEQARVESIHTARLARSN